MAHAFGQHVFGEERRPPAQVRVRHLAPDGRARGDVAGTPPFEAIAPAAV